MSRRETHCSFSAGQVDFSCMGKISFNLDSDALVAEAVIREEGVVGREGALFVNSSANPDSGIVRFSQSALSQNLVDWDGLIAIPGAEFEELLQRVADHIRKKDLFVADMKIGADPRHGVNFRVVSEWAWHSLAAMQLFATDSVGKDFVEEFTVIDCPSLPPNFNAREAPGSWDIAVSLSRRLILVVGCDSAEGLRRGILKVMAHHLSERGVTPIKAAIVQPPIANATPVILAGDLASGSEGLPTNFAGLPLHPILMSWSEEGVYTVQTGTSIPLAELMSESSSAIPEQLRRRGTILVNAPRHREGAQLDLATVSDQPTEACAIFPRSSATMSVGIQPQHMVIVVADALGVLPPAARLTTEQAALFLLNGYKASVDSDGRPVPLFHPGYGTPLRTRSMRHHQNRLIRLLNGNRVTCWIMNAGLAFGPFPDGMSMPPRVISFAFDAIASGELEHVRFRQDPLLGLSIPYEIRGVPSLLMTPKFTWPDRNTYDAEAIRLSDMMTKNFLAMTLPSAFIDERKNAAANPTLPT